MDKKTLNKLTTILLNKQQALNDLDKTSENATKVVELDQSRVGRLSRMDALQAQAMSQEVKRRRQVEQQKISAALIRIGKNDYGYCSHCENQIAIKRLELDPSVSLCINCANKQESSIIN